MQHSAEEVSTRGKGQERTNSKEVQGQSASGKRKVDALGERAAKGNINIMIIGVKQVGYAKYGVVEGSMTVGGCVPSKTCMVVTKSWPSWAFGAMGVGMHLHYILLLSGEWEDTLVRLYPEVMVINCRALDVGHGVRVMELDKVDYCFSDVDPPGRLNVWSSSNAV